jgi:serine/threonine protein kinase
MLIISYQQGVTLFTLIFGDIPFKNQAIPKLYEQIQSDDVSFPAKISVSDDLKDLITKLLEKNPDLRLNMQQIKVSQHMNFTRFLLNLSYL